ncbi:MAG: 50S ribosomal protein L10 [Bacteroidota bacterium]
MTRKEKDQFIDTLAEKLTNNNNFYLTDISELTVRDSNELRRLFFNNGISIEVVKNTLLKKAMVKVKENYESFHDILKGNTAIIFSELGAIPAKLIKQYRKKHNKPILKAAYVEETLYLGDEQLTVLSVLKSKDEIVGDIINLLQSPLKNIISALQSGRNKLCGILETLSKKSE